MVRCEHQTPAPGEIKCVFAGSVAFERVRVAGYQVGNAACGFHVAQARAKLTRAGRPEFSIGDGLLFTQLPDFLVLKADLQGCANPIKIYLKGKDCILF